jgi:polar amino acid transport system substrate-binding protein
MPLAAPRAETLRVCYDQWPPMTIFPTPEAPQRGVVIDMLSDIFHAAGYSIDFVEVPYARGIRMVASGQCDMLPEKEDSPTDEPGFVYGGEPTFRYPTAFVVRHGDNWRFTGIDSLKGYRVATGVGWSYRSINPGYQDFLDDPANYYNVEVMTGDNDVVPRIYRMIANGRVDLYADNILVLEYLRTINGMRQDLDIVQPGLGLSLVEKPIFSLRLSAEKRAALIATWDQGRRAIGPESEKAYLARYGITGLDLRNF